MSLNFDFRKVANYEAVTTDPADPQSWHPVADALVWLSMQCGFNEITPKNVDKVIDRIMAYQVVLGAYLHPDGGEIYIMPVDIRRFVGMRTNATRLTDAQWHRRLGRVADDVGTHLARRLEREQRPGAIHEIARRAAAQTQEPLPTGSGT
jgi:hypothetical protein